MQATVTRCDCGNAATDALTTGVPACEWCAGHEGHRMPRSIVKGYSHLGGNLIASCSRCSFVSAYWECGCDLVHVCEVTA